MFRWIRWGKAGFHGHIGYSAQQQTIRRRLFLLPSFPFEFPPLHRTLLNRLAFFRFQQFRHLFHLPKMSGHRWRHTERLVNTAEVLVHEVKSYGMGAVRSHPLPSSLRSLHLCDLSHCPAMPTDAHTTPPKPAAKKCSETFKNVQSPSRWWRTLRLLPSHTTASEICDMRGVPKKKPRLLSQPGLSISK
jgi:hypothetical protein